VQYSGFCRIGGPGSFSGVHAPSNAGSNVVVSMSLNVKRIGSDSAPAFCLSNKDWMTVGVGGIYRFCNLARLLRWIRGGAIGLVNGAGVLYSINADGQRSAYIMVVGLLVSYIEFWVATGFAVYVLYGVFLSSSLKKYQT